MELTLKRGYFLEGTNGTIYQDGVAACHTIELPWKGNQRKVSCIPEGRYEVLKRYSVKHGWHMVLKDVPGRSMILFHPANHAIKELEGCIAPVSELTGIGTGSGSKTAMEKLKGLVYSALERERVFLTIEKVTL